MSEESELRRSTRKRRGSRFRVPPRRAASAVGLVVAAASVLVAPAATAESDQGSTAATSSTSSECSQVLEHAKAAASPGMDRAVCVRAVHPGPASDTDASAAQAGTALPERCLGSIPEQTWMIDRFVGCNQTFLEISVLQVPDGKLVGTAKAAVINSVEADPRGLTWTHRIKFVRLSGWGDINGLIPQGTPACPLECTVTGSQLPNRLLLDQPEGNLAATSSIDPRTKGTIAAGQSRWSVSFSQMGAFPSQPADFTSEAVRCDTATPNARPGCVLSRYTPTLNYTTAHNGELATHIRDAQASGRPGAPASGKPLTRTTNRTRVELNRTTSCPPLLPRPPGTQCDEYPFASTQQGGLLNGASSRLIDQDDNTTGGNELAAFYRQNRVVDSDPFYVQID